jgi:hypothetical protein
VGNFEQIATPGFIYARGFLIGETVSRFPENLGRVEQSGASEAEKSLLKERFHDAQTGFIAISPHRYLGSFNAFWGCFS